MAVATAATPMSSTLIKSIVFIGIVATLAVNIIAPRIGVTPAPAAAPAPANYGGARLVPPPPGMR